MKKGILVFSGLMILASVSMADVCETKAVKAALKQAHLDRENSVMKYPNAMVVSSEVRHGRLVTVYDVSVLHCSPQDLDECGSLNYGVVVVGEEPSCKAVRVEMTGEE